MVARGTVALTAGLLAVAFATGSASARPTATPPPVPPPTIPALPNGNRAECTMTGPAWAVWGVHAPNAPPRRGSQYHVTAWGITCSKAKGLVAALFPRIPPHSTGSLSGAPTGFRCKGLSTGVPKNRMYAGSCVRLAPATMFNWEPTGGKVS